MALLGPSGAGKTSLLRAVAGLERPREGRIAYEDEVWLDTARGTDVPAERRRVGYVPQDYALFPHLTVTRNVRFASGRDRPDLLDRLGIAHLARAYPHELAGGERQRVALARALAREPRVLLLDEPFAALDALTRERVRDELAETLRALRLPTLLVTHALTDATVLGDRVGVMEHGRLVQLGAPDELVRDPASPSVAALVGANLFRGTARASRPGCEIALDDGGRLRSASAAEGEVQLAIHPWALSAVPSESAVFHDIVRQVRSERGLLVVRCSRLTAHIEPRAVGALRLEPGDTIGWRVNPGDVHVFPAGS